MGFFFKKDKDKDLQRNYRRYYMRGKLDRRTFIKLFSASVVGTINRVEEEINYIKGQPDESFRHIQELIEYLEDENINKDDSLNVLYLKTLVGRINDGFSEQQNMIRILCNTRSGLFVDYLDILEFNEKLGTNDTIRSILDEALADDEIHAYLDTNYLDFKRIKYGIPSDEVINQELANAELLYQIYLKNGSDEKKDLFKDYRLVDLEGNFLEPDYKQILDDTLPDYKAKLREHGFDEHGVRMR